MTTPNSEDDKPTVVEYTDGGTATLPSVAEYRRIGAEIDAQYESLKSGDFMQALLSFDYDQETNP